MKVIVDAFRKQNDRPVPGEHLELSGGKRLQIDVASEGRKYGVAYITPQERFELGGALPPRDPRMGDALQLVRGFGEDSEARILVLHDTEYLYDDHVGEEHESTTITAENKLERDVRDFLVRAQAEHWP